MKKEEFKKGFYSRPRTRENDNFELHLAAPTSMPETSESSRTSDSAESMEFCRVQRAHYLLGCTLYALEIVCN